MITEAELDLKLGVEKQREEKEGKKLTGLTALLVEEFGRGKQYGND